MALLESVLIPLGMDMPEWELKDPYGKFYEGAASSGRKGLLIVFTCNHCPYAIAVWPRLIRLAAHAKALGIETVAINPNINDHYPEDAPERMKEKMSQWQIPFPYLVDASQDVARSFRAQCTPDIYLFSDHKRLVYHGRMDDNWQDEARVKKQELKAAIENLAAGKPISEDQRPTMGCSIKWRHR